MYKRINYCFYYLISYTLLYVYDTYEMAWNFKKVFKKLKNEENIVLWALAFTY